MFGDHAGFIIPAYAISFIVILTMIILVRMQYAARKKELENLQAKGIKRRAEPTKKAK